MAERKFEYTCSGCGKPIEDEKILISMPGGEVKLHSNYDPNKQVVQNSCLAQYFLDNKPRVTLGIISREELDKAMEEMAQKH